jgi:6-phosphogluconolactonase (cycloisomerase 2 family)
MLSNKLRRSKATNKQKIAFVVAEDNDCITAIDISDPENLSIIDSFTHSTYLNGPYNIVINSAGTVAYVACPVGGYITTVDISDPENMSVLDYLSAANQPIDVALDETNDLLYVIGFLGDIIASFDVSDPSDFSLATFLTNSTAYNGPYSLAINSDATKAFIVGNIGDTLACVNISNGASAISLIKYEDISSNILAPRGIVLDETNEFAWVSGYDSNKIQQFDISDPATSMPAGSIYHSGIAGIHKLAIDVSNGHLYGGEWAAASYDFYRADTDTTNSSDVLDCGSGMTGMFAVQLDLDSKVAYVTAKGSGAFSAINIDGTMSVLDTLTSSSYLAGARGIALLL